MPSTLPGAAVQQDATTPTHVSPSSRLMSLDLFRGATIAGMILVNNAGDEASSYWPLKHAQWNGWTPTDLVFPFFLFIVGVAMPFSFSARLNARRVKARTSWACALARHCALCSGNVSERLSRSISSRVVARLWRVAAYRGLLCDFRDSRFVDGLAGMDCHRCRLSRRLLALDAFRAGARIRRAHSQYSIA